MSSGDTGGWIIPWRDPKEVLQESFDRYIARMIDNALHQETLLKRAPIVIVLCPVKKRVKVPLQYLHADGSPVTEARYVLFGENDNELSAGLLTPQGRIECEVDEEDFYTYYFHEDYASKGDTYFDLPTLATCIPNPVTDLGQGFIDAMIDGATLANRAIGSQHAQLVSQVDFVGFPTLAKMLHWTIANNTKHVLPNAPQRRERLAAAIELFMALFQIYALKQIDVAKAAKVWQALTFERLACSVGTQGILISDLLFYLHERNTRPAASDVAALLNSRGKCNAIKWLRALEAKLPEHSNAAIESVETICGLVKEDLRKIKSASDLKVSAAKNGQRLDQFIKVLDAVSSAASAGMQVVLNQCSGAFPALPRGVMKYERLALAEAPNKLQQTASPLTAWKLVSKNTWLEVKYEYSDTDAIPGAEYVVMEKNAKFPFAEGLVDNEGKAKVELPDGKAYIFWFRHDPPFQIFPICLLQPRAVAVDDDILSIAIAGPNFTAMNLEWGAANFTDQDDFTNAPSVRKLTHWAIQKQSPIVIPVRDESELLAILYPVLLNPVTAVKNLPVWPALVWNRCSCAWVDGSGGIRQALLYHLATTKTEILLIDLVTMLNSVGKGNAVRWLEKLLEEWPSDVLVQDIKGILERIRQACGTIASAEAAQVSEDNKRYIEFLKSSLDKVIPNVQALVEETLKDAKDKLVQILKGKIEYEQVAVLQSCVTYRQLSVPMPDWTPVPPPTLKWLDVQYCYADGKPASADKLVLTGGGEPLAPLKVAVHGFRHIVYPEAKKFTTFRFINDPAYVLNDPFKCVANPNQAIADLIKHHSKPLGQGKKILKWGAMDPVCASQQEYNVNPTLGKIVFNRLRGHAGFVSPNVEIEKETARVICFLLMRSEGRDWSTLALLWTVTRRQEQGYLVGIVLSAIYRHRIAHANANPLLADIVKIMNAMGKGNAVRWLEVIKDQGDMIGDDVSQSLSALLLEIREDLLALAQPPGNDQTKNQFCSEANRTFAMTASHGLSKREAEDAGPAVKACIVAACTGAGQLLNDGNSGKLLHPTAIQLYRRIVVQQQREALNSEALKPPPWIVLQYRHHDGTAVKDASYVLRVQGTVAPVSQGRLSGGGFVFIPNPPVAGVLEYYFREEASADYLFVIGADFHSQTRPGIAASVRDEAARGQGNRNLWPFQAPENRRFQWGEGDSVRVPAAERFAESPSIGKLVWWAVALWSPRTTSVASTDTPDADEMTMLLRALIEGGTGGLAVVPAWFTADNAEQNLRIWTSVALNRVGATNGVNAMKAEHSLVRRAVLEHLEFQIDVTALLPANHANEVKPLIALLNKVGKGPAVKWLRLLKNEINNLRDGVRDNLFGILDRFRDELLDLHNSFLPVRPSLLPYGTRIAIVRAQVQAQINAVFQGFSDKLDLMVPAATVRPYLPTGTLRQINEFRQPVAEFPECCRGHMAPVAWHLADPAAILLGYEHADGTPVPSATFILYQHGVQIAALNAQPGRAAFNVNGASGDYEFSMELDAGVAGLSARAQPWTNPYVVLDGLVDPAGTYLTAAANGNSFAGEIDLPWGNTSISDTVAFEVSPTLNRILADCVIAGCMRVSSSNDVRDLTLVLSGLLQNPGWRDSNEEWFRLGTGLLGTIHPNGSVQKGILLYGYNNSLPNVNSLLGLMNWAGKLHAVHWLENEVIAKNYLGAVEIVLTAILTRFMQNLNDIHAIADDALVTPELRTFLTDTVIAGANDLIGRANGKFTTCFDTAVSRVNGVLQNANFPWKYPCGPGRTVYRQREADAFLECGYPLTGADKQTLIISAETAINSGTVFTGVDGATNNELAAFGVTRGVQGRQLAVEFAQMNDAEFRVRFDQLKTENGWHVNSANIIEHDDGTLIRYKPNGDDYQRPPCPTYSVEVVKEFYVPPQNDPPLNRAAFKVDAQGRPVPKTPGAVNVPGAADTAEKRAYYKDLVMRSGHKSLLF